MWTKLVDIEGMRAYGLRTLVGASGVSLFFQVNPVERMPYYSARRKVCDASDAERPSSVLRRAACQSVQED